MQKNKYLVSWNCEAYTKYDKTLVFGNDLIQCENENQIQNEIKSLLKQKDKSHDISFLTNCYQEIKNIKFDKIIDIKDFKTYVLFVYTGFTSYEKKYKQELKKQYPSINLNQCLSIQYIQQTNGFYVYFNTYEQNVKKYEQDVVQAKKRIYNYLNQNTTSKKELNKFEETVLFSKNLEEYVDYLINKLEIKKNYDSVKYSLFPKNLISYIKGEIKYNEYQKTNQQRLR